MNRRSFFRYAAGLGAIALMPAAQALAKQPTLPKPIKLIRPTKRLSGEVINRRFDTPGVDYQLAPLTRVEGCSFRGSGLIVKEGPVMIKNNLFKLTPCHVGA
jgi:hypothetical protein